MLNVPATHRHQGLLAPEAPLADLRAGDNQRPGGNFCLVGRIRLQLDDVPMFGFPDGQRPRSASDQTVFRLLYVSAAQHQRHEPPGMVMQRAVVVGAKELVDVDVENRVPGDDVPAQHVRRAVADDLVRLPRQQAFQPARPGGVGMLRCSAHAAPVFMVVRRRKHSAAALASSSAECWTPVSTPRRWQTSARSFVLVTICMATARYIPSLPACRHETALMRHIPYRGAERARTGGLP